MGIDNYGVVGGVETSVNARFTPWFGIRDGITVTDYMLRDADEAYTLAGLDWEVDELMLSDLLPDNPLSEEYKLRVRSSDGAVLGVGSTRYGIIQNDNLREMARAIMLVRPDAHVESAGALFHGKTAWMLIRLDDNDVVRTGDSHRRYLLVYTSHDGSRPFAVRFTDVRVECMNTFSAAIGQASELVRTVRHTSNANDYVKAAIEVVEASVATFDLMDMEIEALLNTELTKHEAKTVFKDVLGSRPDKAGRGQTMWDKAFDGIVAEYEADFNTDIIDTAWGAVMAVNGYEQWGRGVRGRSRPEAQMASLLSGNYDMTTKALALVGTN